MRLFVALRPPASAVADLQARRPRWPTAPERWHVTLAFLGEVDGVDAVDAALSARLAVQQAFPLRLAGGGTFARGPVWVGVDGDLTALQVLHVRVCAAAREAGVVLEKRPYRPHLTVGRRGQPDPRALQAYEGPTWTAREVELVRSDVGKTAVHTVLRRYPLEG